MVLVGDSLLLDFVVLAAGILLLIQLYFQHKFSYWRKRGVPYAEPSFLFGNFRNCLLQKESVGQFFHRIYNLGVGKPFFGCYIFSRPALVIRDPDLIKQILVKDFNIFYDRLVSSNNESDALSQNLFLLKGAPWKYLRVKMTPIFTSLRMKNMFPLMSTCATQLTSYLNNVAISGKPVEMKEVAGKYATDLISTCAFGIESNCLLDSNAEFREFGRKTFDFSRYRSFEFMSVFMLPSVVKHMNVTFFSTETTQFLRNAFWDTMKQREEKKIVREDFMELLIQLKNKGQVVDEETNDKVEQNGNTKGTFEEKDSFEFKGDNLVAQAAIFFTAGFESNASTTSFTLYELAMQPHLQTRLREEILETMKNHNGKLTYEAIKDMEYLHMVVSETLRKFPPLSILDRVANRDYVIPGTNITIEKGTTVYVPLLGIQMDPEVFPDPEHYDPERFNEENKKARHPFMHLPFGEGPKFCIGKGFGLIAVKTGLANVLSQFEVKPCADTPSHIELNPKAMILASKGGIPLEFIKLKS